MWQYVQNAVGFRSPACLPRIWMDEASSHIGLVHFIFLSVYDFGIGCVFWIGMFWFHHAVTHDTAFFSGRHFEWDHPGMAVRIYAVSRRFAGFFECRFEIRNIFFRMQMHDVLLVGEKDLLC